jgi:predicted DNA-binding transcriptional regulator YafY
MTRGPGDGEGTRRTVVRVLSLLERSRAALSLRAIADACGVSKQTVDRVLADLGTVYAIVEEPDPQHAQRKLYRLSRRGVVDEPAGAATVTASLRVRRAGLAEVRATAWFRAADVVALDDGAVRARVGARSESDVIRIVLAHVPHVRIEAPRALDDELRRLVARVWED